MIVKLVWTSIMFLTVVGFLYIASFGFPISQAFYQKTTTIIVENP